MSQFRPGDRRVDIAGVSTRLRLSLSALAEMADRLGAESPAALAERLRRASLSDWNLVLAALADPPPQTSLSTEAMAAVLPDVTTVIAEGVAL